MGTLLNRRRVMGGGEVPLPYDAEIEYLESSVTQYIQLPLSVLKNEYFEIGGTVIALHPNDNKYSIFGSSPDRQVRMDFYSYNSTTNANVFTSMIGSNSSSGGWNATVGERTDFAISTTFVKFSDTTREVIRPITTNITALRIFTSYYSSKGYPIRICNLYIKVGNAKVYDFIPVRVGQVGYMYDKVSRELFGNNGSGSFILGSDKN